MKHPDPAVQQYQAEFLEDCDPEERRFHELMFMVGNTTYRYHQEAKAFHPSEEVWLEWIEGLPADGFRSAMEEQGFQKSKGVLEFTRYVNEKNDLGLNEYLARNLEPGVLEEYNKYLNDK